MNNVVKKFGAQTVLSNVSFEAKKGEIFGLMGPSGAGKTT
ncbi:MAG: ATP-binding cassette domain-containing protein, partial [Clostridiales bacterium]|nr:ATP-binding cassette domain-containing protein [Clostridiales bacterium]